MKIPSTLDELHSVLETRNYSGAHFVIPRSFFLDFVPLFESSVRVYLSEEPFFLHKRIELFSMESVPEYVSCRLYFVISLVPKGSSPLIALEIDESNMVPELIACNYELPLYKITFGGVHHLLFKAPFEGEFQPFKRKSKHKVFRSNINGVLLRNGATVNWNTSGIQPICGARVLVQNINPYLPEGAADDIFTISVLPEFLYPDQDWERYQLASEDVGNDSLEAMYEGDESYAVDDADSFVSTNEDVVHSNSLDEYENGVDKSSIEIISENPKIIPGVSMLKVEDAEIVDVPKHSMVTKTLDKLEKHILSTFFHKVRRCQVSRLWYTYSSNKNKWSQCSMDTVYALLRKYSREFFVHNFVRDSFAEFRKINKLSMNIILASHKGFAAPPLGVSFSNGYFCYNTMVLTSFDPEWGVFQSIEAPYPSRPDVGSLPSIRFFKVMRRLLVTKYDLCLYRILFCRALIPMARLQTGFCINGKPGTGKGVMLRVLRKMIGSQNILAITLKELSNDFARQQLVNASVLVVNEVDHIDSSSAKLIQALLRRDVITYSEKHKQGVHEFTFKGTIVLSSNKSAYQLFRNAPALVDRFVTITHSPRLSNPDSTLENQLESELVQISQWAVATPCVLMDQFVRTGVMNIELANEANHLERFVLENLGPMDRSFLTQQELYSVYTDTCSDINELSQERGFVKEIANVIVASTRYRKSGLHRKTIEGIKTTGIKNVRVVNKDNPKEISFEKSQYFMADDLKELSEVQETESKPATLDPFAIDPAHVLYPIQELWSNSISVSLGYSLSAESIAQLSELKSKESTTNLDPLLGNSVDNP